MDIFQRELFGNSSTLNIGGATSYTAGTFTPGTSKVNHNGTGAQTILAFNYYDLTVSGARTRTASRWQVQGRSALPIFSTIGNIHKRAFINTGSTVDYNGTGAPVHQCIQL